MDKKEAIRILVKGAELYKENLENRNMLIIYEDNNSFLHIETLFLPRHFLHLTGVKLHEKERNSSNFYHKCLNRRLAINDFDFKEDGTTVLKLSVLLQMMKISNYSRMIGDYNNTKTNLITEKIAGTTSICMGFVKENKYFVPNTALQEDTRNLITKSKRIVTVYSKQIKHKKYNKLEYIAKNFEINKIFCKSDIKELIVDSN